MSNPHNAEQYVDLIPPHSEDYSQIRTTELWERAALVKRLMAASRDLPPMAVGDPPMHPVARAMIAVADEVVAFHALSKMHPDDPRFPGAAAAEAEARAAASQMVTAAINSLKAHEPN